MNEPAWRESVKSYIRQEALPADKFGHQPRLYALAARIVEGEDCDDDVLFAAAWMHDIGVFLGHRPSDPAKLAVWDHVPYTVEKTMNLLREWGFPAEKIDAVSEAIRTHQPKDQPLSREAVVLRDADILEQLGAIGALRAFVKVGRDTRYNLFSDVVPVLERAIRELPSQLRLRQSQQLAGDRVTVLRIFLDALRLEAGELLY
jgi:uncharacterized protein